MRRNFFQNKIPDAVSVKIINLLERIDVDQQKRRTCGCMNINKKTLAIGKSGEAIGVQPLRHFKIFLVDLVAEFLDHGIVGDKLF